MTPVGGSARNPFDEVAALYDEVRPGYPEAIETFSNTRALPEPDRLRFLEAIGAVIDRFGGVVHRHYETRLFLARRVQ